VLGKPLGVTLFCFLAVAIGVSNLPNPLNWKHIFGAGILGGIGFTMSIFITNLAYTGNTPMIDASKMAILLASLLAGGLGILWLRLVSKPVAET
jgi:NhaA family Na+:H+ antiporter